MLKDFSNYLERSFLGDENRRKFGNFFSVTPEVVPPLNRFDRSNPKSVFLKSSVFKKSRENSKLTACPNIFRWCDQKAFKDFICKYFAH